MLGDLPASERGKVLSSMLIAFSILVGLIAPTVSQALFPFIFYALFFVVLFSLCNLGRGPVDVLSSLDRFTLQIVAWQLLALPMALVSVSWFVDIGDSVRLMLLTTLTAGSVFAGPALVRLVGLNDTLATRCMLASTAIMPLSVIVFGKLAGIIPIGIDLGHYVVQINFFLIIPLIFAIMYSDLQVRYRPSVRQLLSTSTSWLSTAALMVFSCGIMHSLSLAGPKLSMSVLEIAAVAIGISIFLFLLTYSVFSRFCEKRMALLAGMLTANRNVALGAALLDMAVTPELLIYVAVSQFPIFLFPIFLMLARLFSSRLASSLRSPANVQSSQ